MRRLRKWPIVPLLVCMLMSVPGVPEARGQGLLRITERQEIEIGRRASIEIELEQPVIRDQEVVRYIDRLGQRLVRESDRSHLRYRFRVINSDDINAFALPGGFIYVNRGLIEATENESELAGVLTHEIGHVVARHSVSQIRRQQIAGIGLSALGPILGGIKGLVARRGSETAIAGLFMKYSRDDEREADRLGAKNLYDAGYDPRGMITFFEKLAAIREQQPNLLEQFFATHPSPSERADNITDLLESFPATGNLRTDSPEFQLAKQRLARLFPRGAQSSVSQTGPGARPSLVETGPSQSGTKTGAQLAAEASEHERGIAAVFAPIFYQGLGEHPRYDWITNFDFDHDWRGDNNWNNAANKKFPLKAYVYYAARETATHYFVHYAAFHPRDYKGGTSVGRFLSKAIRRGVGAVIQHDPTGRADELTMAHENDLEGCLVVAEKNGEDPRRARVVFVETLAHNKFHKYVPADSPREGFASVIILGKRPKLFIEPKGHGIEAYRGDEDPNNGVLLYTFTGRAEDPEKRRKGPLGYDLVPISTTLWPPALRGLTPTYAETSDYGTVYFRVQTTTGLIEDRDARIGRIGSAFRGRVGGRNLARPPWGWFDGRERDQPLGEWFFDPARTIKQHFNLDDGFSITYLDGGAVGFFGGNQTLRQIKGVRQ